MYSALCPGINPVTNVRLDLISKAMTSPSQLTAAYKPIFVPTGQTGIGEGTHDTVHLDLQYTEGCLCT